MLSETIGKDERKNGDHQKEQEWKNFSLKGGGNQRSRADKKGEEEERGAEDRKARWSWRRSRGEEYRQGGGGEQMNRKRVETFREEVSYLRIDDVIYAPEKNPGILW